MAVATFARPRTPRSTRAGRSRTRQKAPVEYSILYTATLCLLAAGAVMVYSASSAESVLKNGDPAFYLKRYLMFGAIGLVGMHLISRRGLKAARALTPLLLPVAFALTLAVKVPHVGVSVNGATRWLGAGPVQFEPSELLKVALVLYAAGLLAARPSRLASLKTLCRPMLLVVGAACLLLLAQPDMGTAMVVCFATVALLVAAGVKMRHLPAILAVLGVLALVFALPPAYRRSPRSLFPPPPAGRGEDRPPW